jgi:hypothetical protein
MTTEIDQLDYTDSITDFMMKIKEHSSRNIALDLWKYYPDQAQLLSTALIQTQHTKKIARLLMKE